MHYRKEIIRILRGRAKREEMKNGRWEGGEKRRERGKKKSRK